MRPRDAELLGRHAFHARALAHAPGPHGDVVQQRMADSEWQIGVGFCTTRHFAIRYSPLRMRDDLHLGVRCNDRERRIVEVVIGFPLLLFAALPPHLDDADLGQERVLDEGIEHDEAGILLHEHVIDVIRLLLGGGDVLRACRLEPHHLVARGEDVHQCRHQSFHRVGDVGRHRLGAAVRRRHVARHVAEVVVERGRALLRQLGRRHGGQGIGLLRGEQRAQICIGHFRHGCSGLQLHCTQQRGSRRRKATPWQNDRAARGRCSTLRRRSSGSRALLDDAIFYKIRVTKSTIFLAATANSSQIDSARLGTRSHLRIVSCAY